MSLKKNNETHANKVYNFLKKKKKPLSAYEILKELASEGISAPTTIYRALNKLVSNGLIHKIESLNAWTVCCVIMIIKFQFLKFVNRVEM